MTRASRQVGLLTGAVILGMAPWFSATVVANAMRTEWNMDDTATLWLTLAVQGGFVIGSLLSALWLLSDRWTSHRLAAGCAFLAAMCTAALTLPGVGSAEAIVLRVLTGVALAGVYPPAIKIAAGWTVSRRGLAIGALVAGATAGSALPYGLQLGTLATSWRQVQWMAASAAVLAAGCFLWLVTEGPHHAAAAPFQVSALRRVLSDRRVLLATGGYLGHMWELYAMWSSIGLFWGSLALERHWTAASAPMLSLLTVGAGAVGCLVAGLVADRIGRSTTTIVAMGVSASCCLLIGPLRIAPAWILIVVAFVWGTSIVADSAQFSAAVTEWAESRYVGTAVTVQTACGFLLTMITIGLVPRWAASWGWQWAYVPLALGPLVGIGCMWRLRAHERARERALVA